ncbi:MAG: PspC domain-containing protein, partial [Chloroflexota bacterium]
MQTKRLFRSRQERMLGGVCGGLAEYLGLDPTVVRLVFLLLFFLGGQGLLVYLIM